MRALEKLLVNNKALSLEACCACWRACDNDLGMDNNLAGNTWSKSKIQGRPMSCSSNPADCSACKLGIVITTSPTQLGKRINKGILGCMARILSFLEGLF